jgi:hypothetical protein
VTVKEWIPTGTIPVTTIYPTPQSIATNVDVADWASIILTHQGDPNVVGPQLGRYRFTFLIRMPGDRRAKLAELLPEAFDLDPGQGRRHLLAPTHHGLSLTTGAGDPIVSAHRHRVDDETTTPGGWRRWLGSRRALAQAARADGNPSTSRSR